MTLATTALASFISCSDLSYINSNLLFLDDLYLESDGNTWFQWVKATTSGELTEVTHHCPPGRAFSGAAGSTGTGCRE